jgi:hypothetical protein
VGGASIGRGGGSGVGVTVGVEAERPLPELGSVWIGSGDTAARPAGDGLGTAGSVLTGGGACCDDGASRLGGTVVGGAGGWPLRAGVAGVGTPLGDTAGTAGDTVDVVDLPGAAPFSDSAEAF